MEKVFKLGGRFYSAIIGQFCAAIDTADGHTQDAQTEFIASFEDLLKRQTRLYKSFDLLLNKVNVTDHQTMVDFLAAYETLLRVESNLYMSFNHLLDIKYENPICLVSYPT
jgi:hypothetical protein